VANHKNSKKGKNSHKAQEVRQEKVLVEEKAQKNTSDDTGQMYSTAIFKAIPQHMSRAATLGL
jgi:hypothetical protein